MPEFSTARDWSARWRDRKPSVRTRPLDAEVIRPRGSHISSQRLSCGPMAVDVKRTLWPIGF